MNINFKQFVIFKIPKYTSSHILVHANDKHEKEKL
jgi:hypothetical protein